LAEHSVETTIDLEEVEKNRHKENHEFKLSSMEKQNHVDWKRISHKPLLFGLEEVLAYAGHGATPLIGMIQNNDLG